MLAADPTGLSLLPVVPIPFTGLELQTEKRNGTSNRPRHSGFVQNGRAMAASFPDQQNLVLRSCILISSLVGESRICRDEQVMEYARDQGEALA